MSRSCNFKINVDDSTKTMQFDIKTNLIFQYILESISLISNYNQLQPRSCNLLYKQLKDDQSYIFYE